MKITATLLLAIALQVSAAASSQTITFSGKKVSLERVFKVIKKQTGYSIIYNNKLIAGSDPVTINVTNMNLRDFLKEILRKQDLSFAIEEENIVIGISPKEKSINKVPLPVVIESAPPITGRITDQAGNALSGISIMIKGTSTGTTSDSDGKFSLSTNSGQTLVISSIEYETKEITVGQLTNLTITLVPAVSDLNDVVVVGYGQKSRRMLTESISTVGSKDIQKLPVASADAAIQGKVSGVQISNAGGSPGSPAAVRIRGVGTVGNTQPLFVIDGIPVGNNSDATHTNPLSTLNPNDIENISVLKDASSSAIYGMRAANGVVLITTKRGKSGKPRVNLDAYYGIQQFPKKLKVNNTEQYIELAKEAIDNQNAQEGLNPGDPGFRTLHPDFSAGSPNSVVGINNDWQDATINKNAPVTNYNVGITGGTENASYFFSLGNFKQEAITQNWDLERYTLRSNTDFKIGKRFKIGQTLALTYQEVDRGRSGFGEGFLYQNNISMPTFFDIYDTDNSIPGNRYGFSGNLDKGGLTIGNELGLNSIVRLKEKTYRLLGGIYAELEIINDLRFRSSASVDMGFGRTADWSPGFTAAEIGIGRETSNFTDSRSESYTQIFTNTLTYEKLIGNHSFNILAGMEYQKLRGNGLSYMGTNFQSTDPSFYTVVSNGTGSNGQFANAGAYANNEGYASFFGRLSYNYLEKYLLTATVRRDGTSRFAENNRWGTFPAVSAAWVISEEPFFKGVSFIDDLKVRASWGQLGNSNTAAIEVLPKTAVTFAAINKAGLFEDKDFRVRLAAILATIEMPKSASIARLLVNMAGKEENFSDIWIRYAMQIASKENETEFRAEFRKKGLNDNPPLLEASLAQKLAYGSRLQYILLRKINIWETSAELLPDIKNNEFAISGDLEFAQQRSVNTSGSIVYSGMIAAHGDRKNGYGLYLLDNKMIFTINQDGNVYQVKSTDPLPAKLFFKAGLQKDGVMRLYINGKEVGNAKTKGLFKNNPDVGLRMSVDNKKDKDKIADYPDLFRLSENNYLSSSKLEILEGIEIKSTTHAISKVIELNVLKDVMKYDKELITAKAGTTIQIILKNPDFMQHNLVVIKPNTLNKVGAAADALAREPNGAKMNYVPKMAEVIGATPLVNPAGQYTLTVTVPNIPGDYPYVCTFPGHWRIMKGILRVAK